MPNLSERKGCSPLKGVFADWEKKWGLLDEIKANSLYSLLAEASDSMAATALLEAGVCLPAEKKPVKVAVFDQANFALQAEKLSKKKTGFGKLVNFTNDYTRENDGYYFWTILNRTLKTKHPEASLGLLHFAQAEEHFLLGKVAEASAFYASQKEGLVEDGRRILAVGLAVLALGEGNSIDWKKLAEYCRDRGLTQEVFWQKLRGKPDTTEGPFFFLRSAILENMAVNFLPEKNGREDQGVEKRRTGGDDVKKVAVRLFGNLEGNLKRIWGEEQVDHGSLNELWTYFCGYNLRRYR